MRDCIPRDRDEYVVTDHALKRIRTNGRFITESLMRATIEEGKLTGNRPGKGGWVFLGDVHGVRVKVVCAIGSDLEPRVITGMSLISDRDEAMNSDYWDEEEVRQIELRQVLASNEENRGRHFERMECKIPVNVDGHNVVVYEEDDYVTCQSCSLTTRMKTELHQTPCS